MVWGCTLPWQRWGGAARRMGGCPPHSTLLLSPLPSGLQMLPVASAGLPATRGVPCLSHAVPCLSHGVPCLSHGVPACPTMSPAHPMVSPAYPMVSLACPTMSPACPSVPCLSHDVPCLPHGLWLPVQCVWVCVYSVRRVCTCVPHPGGVCPILYVCVHVCVRVYTSVSAGECPTQHARDVHVCPTQCACTGVCVHTCVSARVCAHTRVCAYVWGPAAGTTSRHAWGRDNPSAGRAGDGG